MCSSSKMNRIDGDQRISCNLRLMAIIIYPRETSDLLHISDISLLRLGPGISPSLLSYPENPTHVLGPQQNPWHNRLPNGFSNVKSHEDPESFPEILPLLPSVFELFWGYLQIFHDISYPSELFKSKPPEVQQSFRKPETQEIIGVLMGKRLGFHQPTSRKASGSHCQVKSHLVCISSPEKRVNLSKEHQDRTLQSNFFRK